LGNFPILGVAMPLFVGAVEAEVGFAGAAGVEAEGAADFL
jgi:hypothetical protein